MSNVTVSLPPDIATRAPQSILSPLLVVNHRQTLRLAPSRSSIRAQATLAALSSFYVCLSKNICATITTNSAITSSIFPSTHPPRAILLEVSLSTSVPVPGHVGIQGTSTCVLAGDKRLCLVVPLVRSLAVTFDLSWATFLFSRRVRSHILIYTSRASGERWCFALIVGG
ncbi:hypothetical protein C8F04DRAFT_1105657 [Mycena alexandri]|uniref:Uncharacterized protein n=1 Tax=Mycena alexandri TaxID=1745969 RepID=A0AAD6WWZ9_9AGAR|nr:hypothetical protein C8F04DRAFT_1131961 [Mycena alexandri]KAJ7024264.1 hypothetical protein C8F04DRAFT_1131969 [Mycena alexandri]KAJ7032987.1 hypothetical protein C8F04DRAFT_1105657 [Mycena alexandri]